MLVIRLQRTGRKGHAQFRVVVQDSRRTPTSGKIVAPLGHYNPHTKETVINKEKASFYLEHGAQPSDRVARLLKSEGVKLPKWVSLEAKKKSSIRNPEKLRRNRPEEPEAKPEEPATEETEQALSENTTKEVAQTDESPEETDNKDAPVTNEEKTEEVSEEEVVENKEGIAKKEKPTESEPTAEDKKS